MRLVGIAALGLFVALIAASLWPRWAGSTLPDTGPGAQSNVHRAGEKQPAVDAATVAKTPE